jgi:Putative effector of murein hydrolase LrgA
MKLLLQCGILFGICVIGEALQAVTRLPIPGNVFGMVILFVLLCTGILKKARIRQVSKFLLNNMAFFFIPNGVAILVYYRTVAHVLVPFLLLILFTTVIVMGVTGQTAQLLQRLLGKKPPAGGALVSRLLEKKPRGAKNEADDRDEAAL